MRQLPHMGIVLGMHAHTFPDKIGARDLERAMTFRTWHERSCRLANALMGLGLSKGDRVCVLAYNCVEWLEIYAATALAGLVAVPINFRLVGPEIRYIVENCEAGALIVQDQLIDAIEPVRDTLPVSPDKFIIFGTNRRHAGYRAYEDLIAAASDRPPAVTVMPDDPWTLMYTSGTTGKPKGAIRTHGGGAMLSLVTDVELGFSSRDSGLLVMPMCHANSLFFFGAFAYCGAACTIYSRKSFDPEHLVRTLADGHATFTSLVPTHYIMMLGLSSEIRARHDVSAVTKLMVSSAPARRDTKLAIMEYFKNSGLFELYGSTEAGWVTMLHPDEQFTKLGSVGRECVGSRPISLLDADGNDVRDGEPGELYSCNPYTFDGYWKLPEKTREAFRGDYCTVGDLGPPRRGRLHLSGRPQEQHDHFRRRERLSVRSGIAGRRPSQGEGRRGHRHCRRKVGRTRSRRHHLHGTVKRRPPKKSWNGAKTASPATSGRARYRSLPKRTCRAPRPERSCTASCERNTTPTGVSS